MEYFKIRDYQRYGGIRIQGLLNVKNCSVAIEKPIPKTIILDKNRTNLLEQSFETQ